MTPADTNLLISELLISGLLSVLAIGLLAAWLSMVYARRRHWVESEPTVSRYHPSIFELPCRWLVIKSSQVGAVQSALRLHNPTACSWGEGLSRLSHRKLFVSPPIHRWILVIGPGLPDPCDDVDQCFHFLLRLSRDLGEVQFFSSNRPVNHHAWVRVKRGRIRRAYAWAGQTLWNQGPITSEEAELGLKCFEYGQSSELEPTRRSSHLLNAEKVILLAARWSFDPTSLEETLVRAGRGVTGDLTVNRPH